MDIIKFSGASPTLLQNGEVVNDIDTKMWVERYTDPGEFKLTASTSSDVRTKLPIGSIISHLDTSELMIVENHEVVQEKGKDGVISISGRSFETFFENRNIWDMYSMPSDIITATHAYLEPWFVIVNLIQTEVDSPITDDAIPWVDAFTNLGTDASVEAVRPYKSGTIYQNFIELLNAYDLGIRVIRPYVGRSIPSLSSPGNIAIQVHNGFDRSGEIVFSYSDGEIEHAEYLWSNKNDYNSAIIIGRWLMARVDTTGTGYDRRILPVDGSHIDNVFSDYPFGVDRDDAIDKMEQYGRDILAAHNPTALSKTEISKESLRSSYRRDFDIGDVITVIGDYNETARKRIVEYVEIEDETGALGYPVLSDSLT